MFFFHNSKVSINTKVLESIIINEIKNLKLNFINCVTIGTDWCPLIVATNDTVKGGFTLSHFVLIQRNILESIIV